jgi:hypothetical protein
MVQNSCQYGGGGTVIVATNDPAYNAGYGIGSAIGAIARGARCNTQFNNCLLSCPGAYDAANVHIQPVAQPVAQSAPPTPTIILPAAQPQTTHPINYDEERLYFFASFIRKCEQQRQSTPSGTPDTYCNCTAQASWENLLALHIATDEEVIARGGWPAIGKVIKPNPDQVARCAIP